MSAFLAEEDTLVYDSCEEPQTSFGEPKVEDSFGEPKVEDCLQLAVARPEPPEESNVALQLLAEMEDMTSARTVSKKAEKRAAKEEQRAAAEPEAGGKAKAKTKAKAKGEGKAKTKGKAKAKGKANISYSAYFLPTNSIGPQGKYQVSYNTP